MTTVAKVAHKEARLLYLDHLDLHPGQTVGNDLDPLEAGIVGDSEHGSGYHLSRQDNDPDDYSVDESPRDQRGRSDTASAIDIGYFKVTTTRGTFDLYDYNAWLVGLCKSNDPDTVDLREVIYSLDGQTVKRWDRLGKRSTGDPSHRTHTHKSEFRDADGHRMVNLSRRWLQRIGLLAGEVEEDMTNEQAAQLANIYAAIFTGGPSCGTIVDPGNGRGKSNSIVNKADELLRRPAVQPAPVDVTALAELLKPELLAMVKAEIRDAVADLGEGGAQQVRGPQD